MPIIPKEGVDIINATEIVEYAFRFLEIMTAWPVIFLFLILFFRKEIRKSLLDLTQRIKKASVGHSSFEFSESKAEALQDSFESSIENLSNEPDKLKIFSKELLRKMKEIGTIYPIDSIILRGRSILWVDDIPSNNCYEANLFKRLGARIQFAISTKKALEFLSQNTYDLIISDINRVENEQNNPNAGYELLDEINRQKIQTPLVFYTGNVVRINISRTKSAYGVADIASDLKKLVIEVMQSYVS